MLHRENVLHIDFGAISGFKHSLGITKRHHTHTHTHITTTTTPHTPHNIAPLYLQRAPEKEQQLRKRGSWERTNS